jgi:hypothetical protein
LLIQPYKPPPRRGDGFASRKLIDSWKLFFIITLELGRNKLYDADLRILTLQR